MIYKREYRHGESPSETWAGGIRRIVEVSGSFHKWTSWQQKGGIWDRQCMNVVSGGWGGDADGDRALVGLGRKGPSCETKPCRHLGGGGDLMAFFPLLRLGINKAEAVGSMSRSRIGSLCNLCHCHKAAVEETKERFGTLLFSSLPGLHVISSRLL